MIYLIGGPPKVGKTLLAQKLSKELGIPWIAGDTLMVIARSYTPDKDIPKKFPWSAIRIRTKWSNDIAYDSYSSSEITRAYRAQAKTMYEAIDKFAECELADGHDYIVEGYFIEPRLVKKLIKKHGKKNIRAVFIVKTDEKRYLQTTKIGKGNNDWVFKRTTNPAIYGKIAKMICQYGSWFEQEAKKYGFRVFKMDEGFNGQLKKATEYLN